MFKGGLTKVASVLFTTLKDVISPHGMYKYEIVVCTALCRAPPCSRLALATFSVPD